MIRIENIRLYTGKDFFHKAAVITDETRVVYAGDAQQAPPSPGATLLDGEGGLVMPGFYNAHCHAAMTLERGVGSDLNLMDWLHQIFPIEDRLNARHVYNGTRLAIIEMLRRGCVAFADMYFYMDEVARAAVESGIRANICRGCVDRAGLDSTRALYRAHEGAGGGRIKVFVGLHSEYLTTREIAEGALEMARALQTGVHLHAAETRGETDGCIKRHGLTPVGYFDSLGMFERPTIAAHLVHVSDEDIQILARRGVFAAHNPASNLKLASGIAPVSRMLEAGVRVALGTDGPSSNNVLDMMADMRLASLLQKGAFGDPRLMPAAEAIRMATRTGALALGFDDCGMIENGMRADMILVDGQAENMLPGPDPLADIVYSAQGLNVRMTMVNGEILYRDGAFVKLDEAEIKRSAMESARALGVIA
jgi:5-methylthioadenosine/S-adenosylhomocysteine deaminase